MAERSPYDPEPDYDIGGNFKPDTGQNFTPDTGQNFTPNTGEGPGKQSRRDARRERRDAQAIPNTDLRTAEQRPANRMNSSTADDINERLGLGYTGKGSQKSAVFSKLYSSDSKFKKKIAIAGAAAGGSMIAGVLVFLALLPLKIEHIVQNLEGHYGASTTGALDNETENLFDKYMVSKVMPNLGKGACHSTIDLTCIASPSPGSTPIDKLFTAWKQGRVENRVAKADFAVGKKNGRYYLNTKASTIDLGDGKSIFGDANTSPATKAEIRQAARDAIKQGTLYDKVFTRFKLYKLLAAKYGIRRCVTYKGCTLIDKVGDKLAEKTLSAKGYLIEKFLTPINQEYSLALQCVLGGGSTCDDTNPTDDESVDSQGDQAKVSKFQEGLQSRLDAYAAAETDEALSKVLSKAEDISKNGFFATALEDLAEKLGIKVGAVKAVTSAIPVIGWISFAAGLVSALNNIGPKLQAINYAINSAGAVKEYMTYRNVADEEKSGNIDVTEAGSFTNTLSDDMQLDGTGSDMTASPLYASVMNGGSTASTASIFSDIFSGIASADAATPREDSPDTGAYVCNGDKPVPAGQQVCPEEVLDGGNNVANAITNIQQGVPNWDALVIAANNWNATVGKLLNVIGDLTSWIVQHLPGIGTLENFLAKVTKPLITALQNYLLPSPFSADESGGRSFDMVAAGTDVSENQSCQVQLGCAKITNTQAAQIQNEQIAEQKAEFDAMPMFARIFDTNSSYSLVSRLAMDMPTSMLTATNDGLSSVFTNPFSRLANAFSGLFSFSDTAFAAEAAQADPFGVVPKGYASVPSDPETFWDQNCVNGPLATYDSSTGKLDVTAWLDNDQVANQATGESDATSTNACLLIQSSVQSAGAMFDDSLLPQDTGSTSPTGGTSGSGSDGTSIPTGTAEQLAQEILDSPNITFQTPQEKTDFKQIAQTGHQTNCGDPAISTTLLGVILTASQKYKLVLGVVDDGHSCGDGLHDHGIAVDINGITPLDGSFPGTGNTIDWDPSEQPLLSQFDGYMGTLLGANGGGGLGQKECFTSTSAPSVPSNVTFFSDWCDHQHVDVR